MPTHAALPAQANKSAQNKPAQGAKPLQGQAKAQPSALDPAAQTKAMGYQQGKEFLKPGGALQAQRSPGPQEAQQPAQAEQTAQAEQPAEHEEGLAAKASGALHSALGAIKNPKKAIYSARLSAKDRQKNVLAGGHDVSNQDVILEQLAHRGAYGRLDPTKLAAWGYKEMGATQDPESGFRAVLYAPSDEALAGQTAQAKQIQAIHGGKPPPVLAFRGTSEKRAMQDDANKSGVGAYQFASNEGRVAEMMALAGGKVIVAGHSLGGALAQLAASHFPSGVLRVVTFQSPGIPKGEAEKIKNYNKKAAPGERIKSTHHRAGGDLVHLAGDKLSEGDVFTYGSVGVGNAMDHMSFPLARLAAARGDAVPGVSEGLGAKGGDKLVSVDKTTSQSEKSGLMPKATEKARKVLGGAVRDKKMETYVKVWQDVKAMIDSKTFGKNLIMGVIADSNDLTKDQKVKMRDQAVKLLG